MSQIKTPTEILRIAKIAQPLAFIDVANQQALTGGAISNRLPLMIAAERLCVQWDYDTDPTNDSLRQTSNYLYQLLGKYAIQAQNIIGVEDQCTPVITSWPQSSDISNVAITSDVTVSGYGSFYKMSAFPADINNYKFSYIWIKDPSGIVWGSDTVPYGSLPVWEDHPTDSAQAIVEWMKGIFLLKTGGDVSEDFVTVWNAIDEDGGTGVTYSVNKFLAGTWPFPSIPIGSPGIEVSGQYSFGDIGLPTNIYYNTLIRFDKIEGGSPVIITQPTNQTVTAGNTATFTIVANGNNLSYQWQKGGVNILGATSSTYSINNAQSANQGSYNCVVSNVCGTVVSNQITLTVNAGLMGSAWYGADDPYPALSVGNDNLTYQINFSITTGQPFEVTYPIGAANDMYEVIRVPIGEPVKTVWTNVVGQNYGTIPDQIFRPNITIGAFRYYISRVSFSIDTQNSPNMTLS